MKRKMRKKLKRKQVINIPKSTTKVKVMNTEPKGMKLGDIESVTKGAVDVVDGIVLLAGGLFRLVAFAVVTAIDGLKILFTEKKGKKTRTEYTTVAEMRDAKARGRMKEQKRGRMKEKKEQKEQTEQKVSLW